MRSFIRIRPVILGDMPWTHTHTHIHTHTHMHTHTHTHTPKVILIVSRNARLITVEINYVHIACLNLPILLKVMLNVFYQGHRGVRLLNLDVALPR